jgi:hypothetical protein
VRLEPVRPERASEPVHVHLERGDRARGRPLAPEHVDEPLARDCGAAPKQELGEEGALLAPSERDRRALAHHLDRPQ